MRDLVATRDEADFSPATKRKIAAAVDNRCSVPLCTTPAIGVDDGSIINGGTACHIFSAAKNGPRGRGGLSAKQLADASNGIWCCASHGRIIDANKGASFPAAQLQMWKRLAEGRVRRAMAVQYAELGWIHSFALAVDTHAKKQWQLSGNLQKNNLLSERTGSGKSLLLEALASISQGRHARRLCAFPAYTVEIDYETLTRESHVEASSNAGHPIRRKMGGKEVAIVPPDIAILYLNPDHDRHTEDRFGVERLMHLLGVDESTLHALARSVSSNPNGEIAITFEPPAEDDESDAADDSDRPTYVPMVKMMKHSFTLPFNALSGSEQLRVAVALFIALAREEAKTRPVLLCIDALWRLDDQAFRHELSKLEEEHLQLLIVTPYAMNDDQIRDEFPAWHRLRIPSSIEHSLSS